MRQRQEVLNVLLAQVLRDRGHVAAPEQIVHASPSAVRLPDVLLDFRGLRLAIEAEFSDASNAETAAYEKAQGRVDQGIAHIGIAVLYPPRLRTVAFGRATEALEGAKLRFSITTETTSPSAQLHLFSKERSPVTWHEGPLDLLIEFLRRAYEQLTKEDTLDQAVRILDQALAEVVTAIEWQPATTERMAEQLGVRELPEQTSREPKIGRMTLRQKYAINRVSSLILVNAFIFQEVLAKSDDRVHPLEIYHSHPALVSMLRDHWHFILTKINYFPIFYTAHRLLECFASDEAVTNAVRRLMDAACRIVECRASLRHDLAGRIYHRLLQEAKYLGAYYTSVPSATLLLKLALRPDCFDVNWADPESLEKLRIADLACGTGTLLMAAADAALDNYVRACVAKALAPTLDDVHAKLVEEVIYGYDVLPSALHLSASTLTLKVPDKPINATNLFTMPLGGHSYALGTLDFLESNSTPATLFSSPEQLELSGPVKKQVVIPPLDLCVMNPPFTRSVGGNLLFGNLPADERAHMQQRLKRIVQGHGVAANITAGLGSPFVALADSRLKAEGTLALVLPRAVLSGVAWEATRKLIESKYSLEYVVVSHEPDHWNFSENTALSEVLLVARKRPDSRPRKKERTVYVNLWRQPATAVQALSLAEQLKEKSVPPLEDGLSCLELSVGGIKCGEAFDLDSGLIRGRLWSWPCAFAQVALNRALLALLKSRLVLPDSHRSKALPLSPLREIAKLGFDRRDIHDGFTLAAGETQYPALWGHDSYAVTRLAKAPNAYLHPRHEPQPGRPLRAASHLWRKSSRLLVAERFWFTTMRLTAVCTRRRVLSNTWWPVVVTKAENRSETEKALALWLNSTLGIILLLAHRVDTRGPWVQFKKPILEGLSVLNVPKLASSTLDALAAQFDALSKEDLLPVSAIDQDETRAAIDEAIRSALKLPDLSELRAMLSREPLLAAASAAEEEDTEQGDLLE